MSIKLFCKNNLSEVDGNKWNKVPRPHFFKNCIQYRFGEGAQRCPFGFNAGPPSETTLCVRTLWMVPKLPLPTGIEVSKANLKMHCLIPP